MSPWQALYDSPWHQPRLVVLLALAALALALRRALTTGRGRSPFLTAWLLVCGVEIALDAWLSSNTSPLLPDHAGLQGSLVIAFVMFGDVRFYAIVERYARHPSPTPPARGVTLRALLLGLFYGSLVSLAVAPFARTVPAMQHNPRWIFITYECLALAQALAWRLAVIPRRLPDESPLRPWLESVASAVTLQYALWALADAIILAGRPEGYLLRLVPNVFYYGGFVGYVFLRAPAAVRP